MTDHGNTIQDKRFPGGFLVVQPTQHGAERYSRDHITPDEDQEPRRFGWGWAAVIGIVLWLLAGRCG